MKSARPDPTPDSPPKETLAETILRVGSELWEGSKVPTATKAAEKASQNTAGERKPGPAPARSGSSTADSREAEHKGDAKEIPAKVGKERGDKTEPFETKMKGLAAKRETLDKKMDKERRER